MAKTHQTIHWTEKHHNPHSASGEVSRVSAEKVLAAAVAKSEQLGVKVFPSHSCFVYSEIIILHCQDEHLGDGQRSQLGRLPQNGRSLARVC